MKRFSDTFNAGDKQLLDSVEALLKLDASGSLVPHGIVGHARDLLNALASRFEKLLVNETPNCLGCGCPTSGKTMWEGKDVACCSECYMSGRIKGILVKDTPKMASSSTGAKRSKILSEEFRFDLLASNDSAMRRLAKVFALGFKKYGADNWKKGFPNSEYYAHAREHMVKWISAEPWTSGELPEDDLAHAVWNLMAIMWNEEHLPEMCDFPVQQKG